MKKLIRYSIKGRDIIIIIISNASFSTINSRYDYEQNLLIAVKFSNFSNSGCNKEVALL